MILRKAIVLERIGDAESSLHFQRELLKRYETDGEPRSVARVLSNIGLCYKRQGALGEAGTVWQESLQTQPIDSDSLYTLVELVQGVLIAGRIDQALEYLAQGESLIASFPEHPMRATLTLLKEGARGSGRPDRLSEWSQLIHTADPELQSLWIASSAEAALHLSWTAQLYEALVALNQLTVGMLASGSLLRGPSLLP